MTSATPGDRPRTVILLAGPSGSGKSRLTRATGAPQLRLDDFYRADTDEHLPMVDGRIDWDDVRSWDTGAAARAVDALVRCGRTEAPLYSIQLNRATGSHVVDLEGSPVVVAEGIFAPDLLATCRDQGVEVTPLWLDRSRHANFARRLRRDLKQHRKPPAVLVRRGLQLWREERAKRTRALELGFRPMGMAQAVTLVRELQQR
ncbi:uridine kinase [Luteococcus peritonei]|uniref:Uridine kinase n=1 Tax=Luteococcus peritonei TaxID=88874 RepID=A0ABW4RWK0_9ACTN